jgi:hypothetical protein
VREYRERELAHGCLLQPEVVSEALPLDEEYRTPLLLATDYGQGHLKRLPSRSMVFKVPGIRWRLQEDIKRNHIIPGTVKAKGREDGGKLVFEFNDPLSLRMNSIVMTKHEDVRAKAQTSFEARKLTAYLTRK